MAATQQALDDLIKWLDTTNKHFHRCRGEIHGDAKAWHDIYHDSKITNQCVRDWLDWMEVIRRQEPTFITQRAQQEFDQAYNFVMANWNTPRCFDKGIGRHRRQPLFRAFMEIKDVMNKVTDYKEPPQPKPKDDPEPDGYFGKLFDIDP